jgi:uncharacterized protein YggT (Ycf19 family)
VAPRDMGLTIGKISKVLLWLVYAWVVIDIVLLFLAFLLRLFGANPEAGFTEWVYRSVQRAMAPFRGIFEPIVLSDQSVLDTSLLFAMIVYGFVALLLRIAIDWVSGVVARHARKLEAEERAAEYERRQAAAAAAQAPLAAPPATGGARYPDAVVPAASAGSQFDPPRR